MFKLATKESVLALLVLDMYSEGFSSTCGLFFVSLNAHEWHLNDVLAFSHKRLHFCLSRKKTMSASWQFTDEMVIAEKTCSL